MKTLTNIVGTLGVLFLLMVGCTALFANSYNTVQKESSGDVVVDDTSWVPTGYRAWNNEIAYKWSDAGDYSCESGDRCWQMEVVSKNGCDSFYAELALLDSAGNNVGYTNETTSSLKPNQKAIVQFSTYNDRATTGNMAKISCY
jgi:hypothetical protein